MHAYEQALSNLIGELKDKNFFYNAEKSKNAKLCIRL